MAGPSLSAGRTATRGQVVAGVRGLCHAYPLPLVVLVKRFTAPPPKAEVLVVYLQLVPARAVGSTEEDLKVWHLAVDSNRLAVGQNSKVEGSVD